VINRLVCKIVSKKQAVHDLQRPC